jgi:hypothetical protein
MHLKVLVAFVLTGFALYVAEPQGTPQYKEVTAETALSQIDMAIVTDKMLNRSPLETIEHIKEISALNQLQASIAQLKNGNPKPNTFAAAIPKDGYDETFCNLRKTLCDKYKDAVVGLDGQLKPCN